MNRRISQQIDSDGDGTYDSTENYVYDGSNMVMVLDGSGNVTHTFLNGPGTDQVLADDAESNGVTWMLADQQGSVRDVINNSGAVVDHIQYDSYGNIISESNPTNQPRFAYAGMQLDQATGLYYDNARYYDSNTGQFLSQDPSDFAGGNTNLRGYVNNDPINLTDPSGLAPVSHNGVGKNSGHQYNDDQTNSYWLSNFINALFSPSDYGSASDVTQPSWVNNTVTVSRDVSALAFGAASVLSGVAEIQAIGDIIDDLDAAQLIDQSATASGLEDNILNAADQIAARDAAFESDNAINDAIGNFDNSSDAVNTIDTATKNSAISMDQAIDMAIDHVGDDGIIEPTGNETNFQFRSTSIDTNGNTVTKIGRLDVNLADPHVAANGPHLNLEIQINGDIVANDHIPIDVDTLQPGDYP